MGVEPTHSAWEANVLPINYVRIFIYFSIKQILFQEIFSVFPIQKVSGRLLKQELIIPPQPYLPRNFHKHCRIRR